MSQYAHLSNSDPEWIEFASKVTPDHPAGSLEERRHYFNESVLKSHALWESERPKSGLNVAETTIPVEGTSIKIRMYVPEAKADESSFPLVVWFHGGGFTIGDLDWADPFLRLICVNQRVSCVNVDYRLAPEHPFPIPVNDCYRATQWAVANSESLHANVEKGFIVAGDSAGANLAAVVAIKARDDPSFKAKITGQILHMPFICPSAVYPDKWKGELLSMAQNKDAPGVNAATIDSMIVSYAAPDLSSPEVAPLLAPTHANLPPTYLQICGLDPLRDEAFLYEKVLRGSGVSTKYDVYAGQPHGFYITAPKLTQSIKWRADFQKGVEWLLQLK